MSIKTNNEERKFSKRTIGRTQTSRFFLKCTYYGGDTHTYIFSGSNGTGSYGTGSNGTGSNGTGSYGTGSYGTGSYGTGSYGNYPISMDFHLVSKYGAHMWEHLTPKSTLEIWPKRPPPDLL
jgi:hypothetical protein